MLDFNFENFFGFEFVQVLITVVVALLLQLIIRHTIAQVIRRVVRGHKYENKIDERKREDTLISIFRTASAVILWTLVIIVIMYQLEVNLTPLLTGAGLIGVVIALGAQSTLKDYIAGIMVIFENQYRVGDIVTLGTSVGPTVSGVVEDISIRVTRLRDLDGNLHIVPNGSAGIVTNRSFKFANVNVDVGVSYNTKLDKAVEVINRVGQEQMQDERWKEMIFEPIAFLRVDSFNDSSVTLKSIGKVQPAMQWDIAGDFRYRIKEAFEQNDIEIPFPQVVIHQPRAAKNSSKSTD